MPPPDFDELEWFWSREDHEDGFNHDSPQRFYMIEEQEISADWRVRVKGDFVLPVHSQVLAMVSSVMRELLNSSAVSSGPITWECSIFHALAFLRLVYVRQVPGEPIDVIALLHAGHLEGVVKLAHMLDADLALDTICHYVKEHAFWDYAPLLLRSTERLGVEQFRKACIPSLTSYIGKLRYGGDRVPSNEVLRAIARCLALLGDSPGLRSAAALAINPAHGLRIECFMDDLASRSNSPYVFRIQNFDARVAAGEFLPNDTLESPWFEDIASKCQFQIRVTPMALYTEYIDEVPPSEAEGAVAIILKDAPDGVYGLQFTTSRISAEAKGVVEAGMMLRDDDNDAYENVVGRAYCERLNLLRGIDPDGSLLVTASVEKDSLSITFTVQVGAR